MTMNRVDGRVANPYHPSLTAGGSSGGAGALVSFYISPVSVSEDTGGSTRHPAFQNHNFGYDPSRNHYPNYGSFLFFSSLSLLVYFGYVKQYLGSFLPF